MDNAELLSPLILMTPFSLDVRIIGVGRGIYMSIFFASRQVRREICIHSETQYREPSACMSSSYSSPYKNGTFRGPGIVHR